MSLLNLHNRGNQLHEDEARDRWRSFVRRIQQPREKHVTLAITGKYTAMRDAYASILKAVEHAGVACGVEIALKSVETTNLTDANAAGELDGVDGIIVPGGFGARGSEGKIACVKYARENGLPYLGICFGFQMAVIEYARNVCGMEDANSTEFDPGCANPVIDILPGQKQIEGLGGNMRLGGKDVEIRPGTIASTLFADELSRGPYVRMRFRHRYEVDPRFIDQLEEGGLIFSGKHPQQPIMQVLELPEEVHPFFVGTQAHPEMSSRPLEPNPMFVGLVKAALVRNGGRTTPDPEEVSSRHMTV